MFTQLALLPILIASATQNLGTEGLNSTKFITKSQSQIILRVPFVHQINSLEESSKPVMGTTACGPSSVTMALNHMGHGITLDEVISRLPNTIYIKGDKFYDLYSAAPIFNKTTTKLSRNMEDIYLQLERGNPVILNVQNYDGITGHAMVIVGMKGFDGENAESLIIHDPFVGPYREFKFDQWGNLVQPEGYILPLGPLDPFTIT